MLSPGELLRVPDTEVSFDERALLGEHQGQDRHFLAGARPFPVAKRKPHERVYQGVPAVRDLDAAKKKMERLDLPEHVHVHVPAVAGNHG